MVAGWMLLGRMGVLSGFAGIETFDGTGLSNDWVTAGAFTGQQGVVWTYAHACGTPTVYTSNPSITLQTGTSSNKGWLSSVTMTGGCSRVGAAIKQVLTAPVDCVVLVNGRIIANYTSTGGIGAVEAASFEAYDISNRLPFTNEFTLTVSNRLATGGRMSLDDLAWDPFRLFVRLDQTGTNAAFSGNDFDVEAEVYDVGQAHGGGWTVGPDFSGTVSDTNELHLTVIPAAEDIGKTIRLTYAAAEEGGAGATHQADCWIQVEAAPNPRFIDFEGASFGYDTNNGAEVNLNGMNWKFFNVASGASTNDRRIATTSGRFRHTSSNLAAYMESQWPFSGMGTVSLHYAYYGSNRVVTFAVQVKAIEAEEWTTLPGGVFNVQGHDDITNSVFSVDVQAQEELYFRLITTGNAQEIANIDDIHIRAYNDTLPRLAWTGTSNAPVGWETAMDFLLLNRDGVERTWDFALEPANSNAMFEVTAEDQLRLRFVPQSTNEWGDYTVTATATIEGEWTGSTSVPVRVVSPPVFQLLPVATNLVVTNVVDVFVTNVLLHGSNLTEWTTTWTAQPLFAKEPTLSNKSRFRIGNGTTEADVGTHVLSAALRDSGTGVVATNAVVLVVVSGGGSGITNEIYPILSFDITNHVVVSGKAGRVYVPFGTTNLNQGAAEADWTWRGNAVTNLDGGDVILFLTNQPDPRLFFFGVRVHEAP